MRNIKKIGIYKDSNKNLLCNKTFVCMGVAGFEDFADNLVKDWTTAGFQLGSEKIEITDLVTFCFEDLDCLAGDIKNIDLGKLAIWRLGAGAFTDMKWGDDFVFNFLEEEEDKEEVWNEYTSSGL